MNRYFKEVLDTHVLIQDWLGDANAHADICDKLLLRFSLTFSMVTPGGVLLDFAALKAFFSTQRGARQGLNIEIIDMQVIAENERGATVTYKEIQQLPGRKQRAVFQLLCLKRGMTVMQSGGIFTKPLCLKIRQQCRELLEVTWHLVSKVRL